MALDWVMPNIDLPARVFSKKHWGYMYLPHSVMNVIHSRLFSLAQLRDRLSFDVQLVWYGMVCMTISILGIRSNP